MESAGYVDELPVGGRGGNFVAYAEAPLGCHTGVHSGSGSLDAALRAHELVWTGNAKVLEASVDRIVLALEWQRLSREPDGMSVETVGDKIDKLVLHEGARVLLDFARQPRPLSRSCAGSVAFELSAEIVEDPAFADRQISYDVWLVHRTPDGRKTSQHWQGTALNGQRTAFTFRPETAQAADASEDTDRLRVDISGGVRGRLRRDGSLDVAVQASESLAYEGEDRGEHLSHGGEKRMTVGPDDVIRMELPGPPCAAGSGPPCPPGPAGVRQPFGRDMAGHSFALIIKATPAP